MLTLFFFYAECRYADCHNADYHHAECRSVVILKLFIHNFVKLSGNMLSVIIMTVTMLSDIIIV